MIKKIRAFHNVEIEKHVSLFQKPNQHKQNRY